jgi:hypothetical protein
MSGRLVHRGDGWNEPSAGGAPTGSAMVAPATGNVGSAGRLDASAGPDVYPYGALARRVDPSVQGKPAARARSQARGNANRGAAQEAATAPSADAIDRAAMLEADRSGTLVLADSTEARYVAITNVADDAPKPAWQVATWHAVSDTAGRAAHRLQELMRANRRSTLAALIALAIFGAWRYRRQQRLRKRWFR